ncbi:helix-turn-helix transcriptional regulator [Elizabethkingia anophelis]|nr:helix-turn-helix transcriptional regulator [Elizabethkingia anophelis]MCT4063410.1 helix-turn-helix transcriptional regulator [Elizabethkingia anophelis]MCT4109702.1 helix-turn-helix transcriptional regulator [Elizabethkingia anophelis]
MAKRYENYEPISVLYKVLEPQCFDLMKHNYYEFIFFDSGKGEHFNHDISNKFSSGDLFFTKPYEEHAFNVEVKTWVYILRFTEHARIILKDLVANSKGRAVALAKAKSPLNPKVTFKEEDKELVLEIFKLLNLLYNNPNKNENLFYFQVLCLVTIIERNLLYLNGNISSHKVKKDINLILSHIHKFLQDPEKLTLDYIATKFNMSKNLLGGYFKNETGESVKQYINRCRLELIGEKVTKTNLSLSEIAFKFGFVDESHFYKNFKKFYGMSPSNYRKFY